MPQELVIRTVLNGWVVQAGCQTLVFHDRHAFVAEFSKWLEDPIAVEKGYTEQMNRRGLNQAPQAIPMAPPTGPSDVGAMAETERSPSLQDRIARGRVQ